MSNEQYLAGWHALEAAVQAGALPHEVWHDARRKGRGDALLAQLRRQGVPVHGVGKAELDRLAPGLRHQGVVARVPPLKLADESLLRQPAPRDGLILVLDGVQDPHNLGACLRTAEAAGVIAVVIPRDRSAPVNATVRKVASGSAERVPVIEVGNLARALADLQQAGWWSVGLDGHADESLYAVDMRGPTVIVMGSEAEGMRRLTREACDRLVRIPMAGQVESLNVSVAAAICLYEAVRQRQIA